MRHRIPTTSAILLLVSSPLACLAGATSDDTTNPRESTAANAANGGGASPTFANTSAAQGGGAAAQSADGLTGHGEQADSDGANGGARVDPNAGAGVKPAGTCSVTKDADGFFVRSSSKSSYVAYVPPSYDGTSPVQLVVGLHGCGDTAKNFATWGVNPYDTRKTQTHIGISIGGEDGSCWSLGVDDDKVLAAVDDISSCFWIHPKKVVIAGFSSGGQLAYRVGLQQASRFAGIIIEDSGLYAAGADPDALLANATWKLHIAHRTHTQDPVFPLATVEADWVKTKAAGFPLTTSETPGGHDGVTEDWSTWLLPQSTAWAAP